MPVGILFEFEGMNQKHYDAIMNALQIGVGSNGNWADGIISHVSGPTDKGWCVMDVWESQAHFDKFMETRLGPSFAQVPGLPEPKVTTLPVYNKFPR